jgi:predicted nucleic acid-binding protein
VSSVYFDSSVFLAISKGEPSASGIGELIRELKTSRTRIVTSILSVQEVSVASYRKGTVAVDHHSRIHRLSRILSITKDVALTAAKFEAAIKDDAAPRKANKEQEADNKRRKWDCFHIATALVNSCDALYSLHTKMLLRKQQFGITQMAFLKPEPKGLTLFR